LRVPGAGFGGRDEAPASKVMSTLQSDVCSWWSEQLPLPKLICLKLLSKGTQTGNLRQNYLALAGILIIFDLSQKLPIFPSIGYSYYSYW